ncbi:NADPH-dependent FMN reductase [Halobacterium salinarum]|uniref:NADPH-dependent FMN reductase n=1 Tax=Halobacterium salinarum TaxID=2242 RepID=UPI00255397B4|nr:NAD(P)H-dependent oxidoreductase [Halobacterium salinarum]MDL0134234.1 NAD(P)H-dependent oxidoreductase [Halobacterium salinarum]
MTVDTHVVAICGSLSDDSGTRTALRTVLDGATAVTDTEVTTDLIDLRELSLPPRDGDDRDAGDAPALRARVADADALVLGTPMYHGSYSAPLKNALDYCGRDELGGMTVGLVCVAGGGFPRQALSHLRGVCDALDAWTLPHQVGVPNAATTIGDGEITDDDIAARARTLGEQAVAYANVESFPELTAAGASPSQ